jgi:hypothetical protein
MTSEREKKNLAPNKDVQQLHVPELDAIPINFSLINPKKESEGFAYLFMSDNRARDAEWGSLEVTIRNTGETPIELTGKSRLEVEIPTELLTTKEVAEIALSGASKQGWELSVKENKLALKLKDGQTRSVTKDQPQKIMLEGVLAAMGQPIDRTFTFIWSGFGGIKDNSRSFFISREFIPKQWDTEASIWCTWLERTEYRNSARNVYITPYEIKPGTLGIGNWLVLQIENTQAATLQTANTEFIVTFPTETSAAPNAALCTNEQLSQVSCNPLGPEGEKWNQKPITEGKTRYWILTPPQGSTEVFGKLDLASFEFVNLVTQMPLGSSPVLVHWRGIKDRSPGHKLISVSRTEAEPYVRCFHASLGGKPLKNNDAVDFKDKVLLEWELFAADSCVISGIEGQLAAKGKREVLPVEKTSTYWLTPQLTIDGRIKTGNDSGLKFLVRPPEASLTVTPDAVIRPKTEVTLAWQSKSGDCFLSGPNLPREAVPPSGSRKVNAEEDVYQIECIGAGKAIATAVVKFPLANAVVKLTPVKSAKKVKLSWTSVNAAGCRVTKRMGDIRLSEELNGSVEVDIENTQSLGVGVWGNGRLNIGYIVQDKLDLFPEAIVQETVSGSKYTFSWEVKNVETCEVTAPGFKSPATKGEHEWDPKGAERTYTIGAAAQGVILSVQWTPSWKP